MEAKEQENLTTEEKISIYQETLEKCSYEGNGDIGYVPVLTRDEEVEFAQKIEEGCFEYRDYFFIANIRFVEKVAKNYFDLTRGFHCFEKEDLRQEGVMGLMQAIENFDHSKGFRFATYAHWWIIQKMRRGVEERGHIVRMPVRKIEDLETFRRVSNSLEVEFGREPTSEEIAEKMGVARKKAEYLELLYGRSFVSLDKPTNGNYGVYCWGENLEEETFGKPEDVVLRKQIVEEMHELLECLPEKKRKVLERRFGVKNGQAESLQKIGDSFDVTRERVRKIEEDALDALRSELLKKDEKILKEALKLFSEEERNIIRFRFGLSGPVRSRKFVKDNIGVGIEEIKGVERKALMEVAQYFID